MAAGRHADHGEPGVIGEPNGWRASRYPTAQPRLRDKCPASGNWQVFGFGKVGDERVGSPVWTSSGRFQGSADGVVLGPVVLGMAE